MPHRTPSRSWGPATLRGAVIVYLLLGGVTCFWRLGAVGLIHMEGMIVDGARRMLATGDWLVPRVYGEVYTFKPALAYWLAALAMGTGETPPEWLVRFPFALTAWLMGLAVLLLVSRVAPPSMALAAAVASVSAGLFVQHVRIAEFDVPLAAGVGVAVVAACVDLAHDRSRWGLWLLAYLALAAAFLAKGLPALMCFGPGLLAAAVAGGRLRRLFGWRHLTAAALFLLVVGGYLAAVYRVGGAEAFDQPLRESRMRGLGWGTRQHNEVLAAAEDPAAGGTELSARPFDTVVATVSKPFSIWTAFLPWSLLAPFAFARGATRRGDGAVDSLMLSARWFLLAGAFVFLLIPTNETRYFLPLAVPFGILAGVVLTREGAPPRGLLAASVTGVVLSGLAMLVLGVAADTPPVPVASRSILGVGGAALLALAIRSALARRVGWAPALLVLAALGWTAAESLATQPRRAAGGRDLRAEAAALARHLPATATLWVLGPADLAGKHASLYYYLGRPVEAFRPPEDPPPADSHCLLSTDRMPPQETLVFDEIARVSTSRYTYLLGRCGGS